MQYFIIFISCLLFTGCTHTPTPQAEKESHAKAAIEANMSEAQKAQSEYVALQNKRRREGVL